MESRATRLLAATRFSLGACFPESVSRLAGNASDLDGWELGSQLYRSRPISCADRIFTDPHRSFPGPVPSALLLKLPKPPSANVRPLARVPLTGIDPTACNNPTPLSSLLIIALPLPKRVNWDTLGYNTMLIIREFIPLVNQKM